MNIVVFLLFIILCVVFLVMATLFSITISTKEGRKEWSRSRKQSDDQIVYEQTPIDGNNNSDWGDTSSEGSDGAQGGEGQE